MILVKKLKFFHVLYLSKINREKVFADVLDKKEAFKDYKTPCNPLYSHVIDRENKSLKKGFSTFYIANKPF